MPKGYGVPKTERGMMPWATTRKMLEGAQSYWLVTIDADGKPHLVGQWGAWIDERWYFDRYLNHGDRFIEAAYHGLRWLSWMEVVVGDPLCRVKP